MKHKRSLQISTKLQEKQINTETCVGDLKKIILKKCLSV